MNENSILVIEDDEILNAGLCYNLQQAGMDPHPAYRLSEGREFLRDNACDLILLDVNMPDANSHFLRTSGPYSTDSQEHAPDTNYYAAKGSLHE